eukprot:1702811-Ditylum_brightwellii.AAC.1
MLQQFAAKSSPKGHLDVVDLLPKLLAIQGREAMLLADATTMLERNQNDVVQNEVEDSSANNLAGSLVDEIASAVESTCESDDIRALNHDPNIDNGHDDIDLDAIEECYSVYCSSVVRTVMSREL